MVDSVNKNQLTAYVKESNIDSAALLKAFDQIHEALQNAKSDLEKAGLIQYFKFTFELEW